jgi:hypothetical protein
MERKCTDKGRSKIQTDNRKDEEVEQGDDVLDNILVYDIIERLLFCSSTAH